LMLAEGGTERGHSVTIARGPRPAGPFEPHPANPILSHRSTTHPIQNTGHADLVRTGDGGWAAVYLGARPRGSTPGFHVLGRETFIAGVAWVDGWPVLDESRFAVAPSDTAFIDQFDTPDLNLRWVVPGGDPAAAVERHPSGGIQILPASGAAGASGLLCARVRDLRWRAEAVLDGPGRFEVRLDDRHAYGLSRDRVTVRATARVGDLQSVLSETAVADGPVVLRIEAVTPFQPAALPGNAGPDEMVLSLVEAHGAFELARLDGRYLSTEVASGFTGRMLALGATECAAHVRSVSYRPEPDRARDAVRSMEAEMALITKEQA
jgi:hypothetical protein